jgi:hypothetical protein
MNVTAAPLFLLIGPFVDNDKPPPNPYPDVVAMTIIVVWTVIVSVLARHQASISSSNAQNLMQR